MKRYGVTPNLLVIPPQERAPPLEPVPKSRLVLHRPSPPVASDLVSRALRPQLALYMSLAPDEKITYKEGGPAAVANFEAGVQGFTTRAFRGCGVVTSEPFEVSDEMEAVQMLQRFTQVGEFYVMSTPEGIGDADTLVGFMDVLIYDEESDRHVKISYRSALEATGLFDVAANGDVAKKASVADNTLSDKDATGAAMKLSDYAAAAAILLKANETPGTKVAGAGLKGAPIVLARPFIEHAMLSAVLTVSGGDTGATIFGPSDMQVSTHNLHWTSKTSQDLPCAHSHTRSYASSRVRRSRPTPL